ncbi:MAG TPA: hemolysin III family protein [Anaerolineae bacterium]
MKRIKDPVSGLTHLASAIVAVIGAVALWWLGPSGLPARVSLMVYSASSVVLFGASSVYHLIKTRPSRELWLRKLDHTAIFLFIAGTYTPVCVIVLTGVWSLGLLIAVWSLAGIGILFKLAFMHAPRWLSVTVYLAMGWLGVIAIGEMLQALPLQAFIWLLIGGLLYSVGAVVYATKRLNLFPGVFGFHEVWHLFVTAASAAHYVFIVAYVVPFALR